MSVSEHGVEGSRSPSNWPCTVQLVHADEPEAANSPMAQSTHGVVLSISVSARPASHGTHVLMLSAVRGSQY